LFELLLILRVDGGAFLADELGLFDGKFFVGFEVDFAGFFEGFLTNEGGHFLQLGGDLVVREGLAGRHVCSVVVGERCVGPTSE